MADKENGGTWNFTNTPLYQDVGSGLQLVGITHKGFPRQQPTKKILHFRRVVTSLDHVAFEGSSSYTFDLRTSRGYEDLAMRISRGQRHFLDEGANYAAGLEHLGMSVPLYGILQALRAFNNHSAAIDPDQFATYMTDNLTGMTLKASYRAIPSDLASKIVKNLLDILVESFSPQKEEDDRATVLEIADFSGNYFLQFRDTTVYAPRLRELQQLSGRKGAIVGANHVLSLAILLSGHGPELPSWQEYVAAAPAQIQESLGRIERYITKNLQ